MAGPVLVRRGVDADPLRDVEARGVAAAGVQGEPLRLVAAEVLSGGGALGLCDVDTDVADVALRARALALHGLAAVRLLAHQLLQLGHVLRLVADHVGLL